MSAEDLIRDLIGKRIIGISRIWFVFEGEINEDSGACELSFDDKSFLIFDSRGGESLDVTPGPWTDPYASSSQEQPAAPEFGKWARFDISRRPGYSNLLGRIEGVSFEYMDGLDMASSPLIGTIIRVGHTSVRLHTDGVDEMYVDLLSPGLAHMPWA